MCSVSVVAPEGAVCGPGFRGVLCVSFGDVASLAVAGDQGSRVRHELHFSGASPEALAQLRSVIGLACVGVRLVLTGPPADIQAAAAVALECGLVDGDVTLISDGAGPRVVFCAHCRTSTSTWEPLGSMVGCGGCGIVLAISDHFSSRIGGYLGYSAHAEEAA